MRDGLTDELTDRSDFIGPLNFSSSGPKSEKTRKLHWTPGNFRKIFSEKLTELLLTD